MSTTDLPAYTPSDRAPLYVAEPQDGEERLQIIGAPSSPTTSELAAPAPTGASPNNASGTAVVRITLERPKKEGARTVLYKQNEIVKGAVLVDNPQGIKSLTVKLEGRQYVTVYLEDTLNDSCTLFTTKSDLWQATGNGGTTCPPKLEFAIPFPTTFKDGTGTNPLPPSFTCRYPGPPLIVASVMYTVTVVVVTRQGRFMKWAKEKTYSENITYRPRWSPPLPTPENGPAFLSVTKQTPEEWCHVTTSIPSDQEGVGAIDCHLFIPAGRTYPFDTEIPFQLQLRAPMNHLLAAQGVIPTCDSGVVSSAPTSTQTAGPSSTSGTRKPLSLLSSLPQRIAIGKQPDESLPWVRIYLQRRVTSKIYGQNAWNTDVIGEAQLSRMVAPEGVDVLVWDGRVKCAKSAVVICGFSTSRFEMKDFIVIRVKPSNVETSPWREHTYVHPIRLVTDPYQQD